MCEVQFVVLDYNMKIKNMERRVWNKKKTKIVDKQQLNLLKCQREESAIAHLLESIVYNHYMLDIHYTLWRSLHINGVC